MRNIGNIRAPARSYGELEEKERHKILDEVLIQHQRSGKGARSLSRWVAEIFGVHIPVATVDHWLKTDTTGRASREGVRKPHHHTIRPYSALAPAERDQVYRLVTAHHSNLVGPALQQWVRETCGVRVPLSTLDRWRSSASRPPQLFWPALGHNTQEDWQAMRTIYQQVRPKERRRFPIGFWSGPGCYARAADLLRYLTEDCLGWSYEDTVLRLTRRVLATERLIGALVLYNSLARLIRAAYPDRWSLPDIRHRRATHTSFVALQSMFERAKARLRRWGVSEADLQAYWPVLQQAGEWLATVRRRRLHAPTVVKLFLAILRAKQTTYAASYQRILTASGYPDDAIYQLHKRLVLEQVIRDDPIAKRQHLLLLAQKCLGAADLPAKVRSRALEVLPQIAACKASQAIRKPHILAGIAVKVAFDSTGTPISTNQAARLVGASYLPKAVVNAVPQARRG